MATIQNLYTGDGSTVLFSFTFPYIETTDIKVSLDGVDTTAYSLANATTVEFVTAPATGVAIRIYRDTTVDTPKAVFFPGSAIRAQDLNDNFEQNLFVIQEADFNNEQSADNSAAALTTAQAAETSADQANVQSAAAQASAAQAQTDATQAAADAASAQADATQAAADASAAQISADQANTAVQEAAIYTPVANVAAIPASPSDQDRVSVLDSTGIASFTPLTGLPVGPTYDSGVYVNLVYQSTGSTWDYVIYGPNDPDVRYLLDTADSVNTSNITNGAVTTDKLPDSAVITAKLDTDSVTTDKVLDAAVTPTKLDRAYVETSGDTMTGDLFINGRVILRNGADATNRVTMEGSTGAATFLGQVTTDGLRYNNLSGRFRDSWDGGTGGVMYRFVDDTQFKLCYSTGNNITWSWSTSSQVVATIDGALNVVCGTASDYRLKENVELSTYGTDAVKALRPVTYDYKESGTHAIGFIAHEAAEAVPGAATGEKDGEMFQSINTYPIVATLTKALQESIERIEALEAKVQTLENN